MSDTAVRIGISACFFHPDPDRDLFRGKTLLYLEQSMAHWVQSGGALTYLVPTVAEGGPIDLADVVADLDGLLLHGGADICPRTYGQEPERPEWEGDALRDRYELDLLWAFHEAGKPVLGICRGHQLINVAFGGTLHQDLVVDGATDRVHRDPVPYDRNLHEVDLEPGSGLGSLYPGAERVLVNSVHHQGIAQVGADLAVEARSTGDGIVEAVRLTEPRAGGRYVVGVQWHPEFFAGVDDGSMLDNGPILAEFLDAARVARAAGDRR